jgi:hypothetical protein
LLAFLLVLKIVYIEAHIHVACEMTVIKKLDMVIIFEFLIPCSGIYNLDEQAVFLRVIVIIMLPGTDINLSV